MCTIHTNECHECPALFTAGIKNVLLLRVVMGLHYTLHYRH